MYQLDPRPYPRLTREQIECILREVKWYLTTMEHYRLAQRHPVAPQGEQLELFPAERLDV
jgi:hypothetical protein